MPLPSKVLGLALLCLGLGGPFLAAEDPNAPEVYRYGLRLLAALPRQDFHEIIGRTGLGVGLSMETELSPGTVLETRFDYLRYPQDNHPGSGAIPAPAAANAAILLVNSAAIGVDLRHSLPVAGLRRIFGSLGVMGIRYEFDSSGASTALDQNGVPVSAIRRVKAKTPFKLGLAVGLGVDLTRNLALAERFTSVNLDGTTLGTLETSLSYRF